MNCFGLKHVYDIYLPVYQMNYFFIFHFESVGFHEEQIPFFIVYVDRGTIYGVGADAVT